MFTGIIKELGEIISIKNSDSGKTFSVKAKNVLKNKKIGQSIAVNGACVTITKISKKSFEFNVMPETLKLTNLGLLKEKSPLNLEPALKMNDSIDGHIIQGHIDTVGTVLSFEKKNKRIILKIKFPKSIAKFIALKGSIAINGVSLTISHLENSNFSVELIPHTLKNTNLSFLKKNDKVNLEADLIARYLNRLLKN